MQNYGVIFILYTYSESKTEINSEVVAVTLDRWHDANDFKIRLNFKLFEVS